MYLKQKDSSAATGVLFLPKLNIWEVQWYEQGKQRIRWLAATHLRSTTPRIVVLCWFIYV